MPEAQEYFRKNRYESRVTPEEKEEPKEHVSSAFAAKYLARKRSGSASSSCDDGADSQELRFI